MKFVPFDKPVEERETLLKEDQEKKMRFVPFSPEEQERVKMKSLEQAWSEAAAINPDEEAEAIRLAEANGWPLWMVKRKPENKKLAKANVEMPDWAKLSKDYPKTANFLGIPRNMALSKDDVESLKKIEDLPKTGIPKIVSSFMAGQKETSAMQRYADLLIPKLMGTRTLSEEEEEELSTLDASLDDVDNKDAALKGIGNLAQFFIGPFSKASRNLIPMTLIGGAATAMMSRTQGSGEMLQPVASALATAPAAISSIAQTAFHSQAIKDGMKVESALLYRDLMNMTDENGVPLSETVGDDVMKTVALLAGGFSGAMEALPLEYFSEIIPGLKQMSSRAAFRAIMKHPKARGALVSFVKNYVIGLGVESGTEAVQRGITKTGEEIVKAYARSRGAEVNNDTLKEWAQDLGQEFVGALESFSLAMIPAPGMRYVSDLHRVRQAEQQQQMFVNIAESVSGSKLKDRAPDALREFVSQALDGTDYASTYVDAEALVTYFQDQGVPLEEGASLIGTTAEEVRTAVETSGKVELSTGDWAAKVAGTPLGEALMEDITFDPEVPTLREKAVEEKELVEIRRRDIERAEQMLAEDKALQEEIDYVGDNVRSMGLAAGIDPSEVDQTASIMQARAKTVMGRYGIKPKEWFDAMGLEIRSGTGDLVTAGGITYGQDGNIQINDAFREWFGDSQVVDEKGEPLVVYHGTRQVFDEFDGGKVGANTDFISEGFHFTSDEEEAEFYTEEANSEGVERIGASPHVGKFYLKMENPLRIETKEDPTNFYDENVDEILLEVHQEGHDGVVVSGREGPSVYVAFSPTQIKSVYNEGTWSGETGNIYKQTGIASFSKISPYLTKDEKGKLRANTKSTLERLFTLTPDANEMASVAFSGRSKRGWYENSAKALVEIFGAEDSPRFAGLLAALSPQCSVETNLLNALNSWVNWVAAGRPTTREGIIRVLGESVQGNKGEESVLDAWINNSVRALTAEDPEKILLSGPKVNSFMLNLRGVVGEVTNDAWMANYAAMDQALFGGSINKAGTDPGKNPGYMAMAAAVRKAAKVLSKRTGEKWTPAEIQETVWSWAKTLLEKRESAGEDRTTTEILAAGGLSHDEINDTPDFEILFVQGVYRKILEEGGYGEQIGVLTETVGSRGSAVRSDGGGGSATESEGSGVADRTFQRHLRQAAERLEKVYKRRQGKAPRSDSIGILRKRYVGGLDVGENKTSSARPFRRGDQRSSLRISGIEVTGTEFKSVKAIEKVLGFSGDSAPSLFELDSTEESARAFRDAIASSKSNNKFGACVDVKDVNDYQHCRLFTTEDGSGGFALTEDGDMVSVYVTPGTQPSPFAGMLLLAIQEGARKCDCYDTVLPDFYQDFGFRAVARMRWNDEFKPDGWKYSTFKRFRRGRPDVVFMVYDPDNFEEYKHNDGKLVEDYGEALELQSQAVADVEKGKAAVYYQSVWHGSPYRYDKPSLQYIGSGEGAQVFGWGLYGAQLRSIAEEKYWKTLGDESRRRPDADIVAKYQPEWDAILDKLDKLERQYKNGRPDQAQAGQRDVLENELDAIHQKMIDESVERHGRGQLQEWDIPEDDVMLHWDDSLYDQPENVKELLRAGGFGGFVDRTDHPRIDGDKLYLNMTGEEFYRMQTEDEGSPKAASEYLNSLGIKGIKYLDGNSRAKGEGTYNYVIFDDKAIEVLNTYYQQQGALKGQVAFSDGQSVISLFESADRSTLLHETGHLFLNDLRNLAQVNDKAREDLQSFYEWLDIDDWDSLTDEARTAAHEKFARTFEGYLMTGEAPSDGLRRVFATFRNWLVAIYRDLTGLSRAAGEEIELSDEVKDLFDRLLATDDEIEQARALAGYDTAVEATAESLALHREADDDAKAELGKSDAKALSKRRKDLTKQVRKELSESRGYRALSDMKKSKSKGGIKINDDEIVERYGDDYLIRVIVPLGISSRSSTWGLEDIATMYGYTSGDEMIQEIVSLPPLAEAVKARVDVQMKLEATPEQGSGQGELRNEKRLEALSEEREALLGGMEELNEDDAPDWLALMDKIEAEKEDPLSRDNVVKKIKDLGGIKYDSVVSEWGQSEASDLRKRTGAGILRKQGLSFDTMAQELRDAGMPIGTDQDLYNLLMSRPEKTKPVDVAVDSESLPWLVWILGYEGAGKYLRRRRRSVQKEQKANQESFDADREAGKDVEELRQAIVDAQVEIDYIKRALKVLDSKKQKVQKTDDDFVVDFNPSTFETTEGKVDWQQTTVVEAIEQQGTSPATMQDAWTLASRISRIAHAEGIKEGRKRASEARKKIRDKVRAANEERINWKKNVAARKQARVEVAKNVARKTIEGKKISEIKPSMYIAAEKKAKRAVEKALKDNNFDEATRQKDIQIVNAALAMEATQARKIAAKIERYLKKKAKQRKPGSMDVAYLDKIHSLLDGLYFGVRKAKQESEIAGFLEWKKQKEDEGEIVVVPDRLLSKMGKTHWQDLTFAELVELGDSVKNLEHLGRMKNSLMLKHRQKEFDEVVDLFVKSVRKNVGVKHPQNLNPNQHMADKALSGLRGLAAMHKRMEFLLRYLDGEKDMGIAWDIFFRPFVDAQNAETVLKESSARDMAEIFSLIDVKHMMKERYYPSVGMSLSKENILSMALNWGAEGNRQRLLDGHNLTEDQVMELFRELTESDWAFVQAVWDYTASFRPEIAELEKEMTGVEPNWVEPAPFVTPSGITMRGGYHHIKYDPTKNIQAFEFEEKKKVEDFMSVQAYRAQTRHGFTKARASEVHGRPLDLHLSVISEHINEVIHDLTHRRAVRDVAKLLDDKRVQKAIAEAVGPEMWREFKPWLKNIASVGTHEPLNWWEKVMSRARKGVTVGVLGLKLTTSMMQVMSIFGASERIGQAGMLKSILSFYHNPAKWKAKAQFVFDRSPEVRNRRNTWDRDVKYVVESQVGRGKKGRITAAMFYTHGLVDAAAVIPVWLEAYDQKLAETGNEQKAIYYADSVIRQTQPASNPKDLPSVMRGHPSRKLFTMFYSYFSVLNNLFASRFHTTKGVKDLPRLVGSFIWLVFVPAVLGQIATGRGPDDDDDWAEWMLSQTLLYPTQTLIGVRDVVSAMAHPEFGYKMSPAVNAFESVIRLSVQAKQAIVDDDDWDDVLEPALEVAGYWGQFPVLQTKITLGQLILYMAGEESDWDISQLFVKKRR